jgi:predicted P-loop ATPase
LDVADAVDHGGASRNAYHPVREYLETCRAARVPGILDTLAARVFGVTDAVSREFLKRFLIASVRRIYHARRPARLDARPPRRAGGR